MDSILNLKVGMEVEIHNDPDCWNKCKILEIVTCNKQLPNEIFMRIFFDNGASFDIWNHTPLKVIMNNIRIIEKKESIQADLTVPYCTTKPTFNRFLSGINKDYPFDKCKNCLPYSVSSITSKEDPDLPPGPEIELYKETFGDIYAVDKNGNKKFLI